MTEQFPVEPTNPGEVLACAALGWFADGAESGQDSGFIHEGGHWQFRTAFPYKTVAELIAEDPREDDDAVWLGGLRLDWWQPEYGLNQPFKFWAGQQSARSVLTNLVQAARGGDPGEWLGYRAPTTGRLGVDPEGTWDSLGLGWSVNEHNGLQYLCRPFVELLAFLALQYFPVQGSRDQGFSYHLWRPAPGTVMPLAFAGASRFSLSAWRTAIAGSGSNKYLQPAQIREESR